MRISDWSSDVCSSDLNVRELNRAGTTVLLTTHYLEEAEELCDKIAIINHGRVIACDDTDSLLARLDSKALTLVFDRDLADVPDCLMAFHAEQTGPRRVQFRYHRSEARRVGKEWVRTCRSRWSPDQ